MRLIYELERWFCEGKDCYQRFATKRGIEERMDVAHPGEDHPNHTDESSPNFKASDLEAERSQH